MLLTPIGIVCADEPLKLNVLVVPGETVPAGVPPPLLIVNAPARLSVAAPPDITIWF